MAGPFYSDNFVAQTGTAGVVGPATDNTTRTAGFHAPAGFAHGRLRVKQGRFTTSVAGVAATEIIHVMKFKSGDRLYALTNSDTGASTDTAGDVGLYVVNVDGTGTLVRTGFLGDKDLFGSAVDMNANANKVDLFVESAVLSPEHKGLALWQLANVGAATHTSDPMIEYYVSITVTTDAAIAAETVILEAFYNSGD